MDAKFAAWVYVFTVLVLMLCAGFYVLVFNELPQNNRELAFGIIGAVLAKFGDAVAYLINSTKASADKNEMLLNAKVTP